MFFVLWATTLPVSAAVFVGGLGMSLVMEQFAFSAASISSTATAGGMVSLVLLPLIGNLSDRLGRSRFVVIAYILAGLGLLGLGQAAEV